MDDTKPTRLSRSERKKRQEKLRHTGAKLRDEMVRRFPSIFVKKGGHKKPLKIGLSEDLISACEDIKPWKVKAFLIDYTHGPRYLLAVASGGPRYALDGSECGEVTKAHQEFALSLIKKHWPKWETKLKPMGS